MVHLSIVCILPILQPTLSQTHLAVKNAPGRIMHGYIKFKDIFYYKKVMELQKHDLTVAVVRKCSSNNLVRVAAFGQG